MLRSLALTLLLLSACMGPAPIRLGADGDPLPILVTLDSRDALAVEASILTEINGLRGSAGAASLVGDPALRRAAGVQAAHLAAGGHGHTGVDGADPAMRATIAGYAGSVLGEATAETYDGAQGTLADWLRDPATRDVILDPAAREMGLAFVQLPGGKIWWVLVTGAPQS